MKAEILASEIFRGYNIFLDQIAQNRNIKISISSPIVLVSISLKHIIWNVNVQNT